MHTAKLWVKKDGDLVWCRLCSHFCRLESGDYGKCGVRVNQEGVLKTLVYDRVAAINVDPIEKKPLFHFQPGTRSFSLGTMGCNFSCAFCQNDSLSQTPKTTGRISGELLSPEQLVNMAKSRQCFSISYTYSEPTVFFELMLETCVKAKKEGLTNVLVSNGFMSRECLRELRPLVDGINVDLKSYQNDFYQTYCGGSLKPVLANLKTIKEMGWWLEVTTLLVPGLNDSQQEMKNLAGFICRELGPETPWHISRFHPCYKMLDRGSTAVATLEKALQAGKEAGLVYVYLGNVPGHVSESTLCPVCGQEVLSRSGFSTRITGLREGKCSKCGAEIAGYGM
ncbi:MAG: AmmeMemoRadiSam system radical SAM enzyme [Desulfohalobiaceae bacterium]|nr:AmmeMemoRadiSam system radical SAM enzyme [Desulfohalobiaceae bacterium]